METIRQQLNVITKLNPITQKKEAQNRDRRWHIQKRILKMPALFRPLCHRIGETFRYGQVGYELNLFRHCGGA
jgi:hypothetical protein